MPKRGIVTISKNGLEKIKEFCVMADISEAAFSRKFEKHNRWVSELRRGRSMPSSEEAAEMCALLHVEPEEILIDPADIELVKGLLDEKKNLADGKERPANSETPSKDALLNFVRNTNDRAALLAVMDEVNKKLQELG